MPREEVNVAASIIADISAGIYRSPAGALKELISNAFDADATNIRISTGAPTFRTFTASDDGTGMTTEEFRRVMSFIGGSSKRDVSDFSPLHHRPLVGRIGIGLLAIAQISKKFTVTSSVKGQAKKFSAVIDLSAYLTKEARRAMLGDRINTPDGKITIGTYELEETAEDPAAHYTRIVMDKIDPGFRSKLADRPAKQGGFSVKTFTAGTMEDFLKTVQRGTVAEHGAYAQMVWELAITAPVQYLKNGPIEGSHVADPLLKDRLAKYGFSAFVDGVQLRKPVLLPQAPIEHKVYPLKLNSRLEDGRRLVATGYLYWQKGRILPRELQGILVRVRDVAIGGYDPTYLGYPHHEGWKFSQLTGEIYVDEGLDQAVNIDRSSFRESDDAFTALQGFLFERLKKGTDEGAGIFSDIKRETGSLRDAKRRSESRRRLGVVKRLTGAPLRSLELKTGDHPFPSHVEIGRDVEVDRVVVDRVPLRTRPLFAAICALIEAQLRRSVPATTRRELIDKLAQLFEKF